MKQPASSARSIQLFESSIELPVGERTTWLKTQCGADQELLVSVQKMIVADGATDQWFYPVTNRRFTCLIRKLVADTADGC